MRPSPPRPGHPLRASSAARAAAAAVAVVAAVLPVGAGHAATAEGPEPASATGLRDARADVRYAEGVTPTARNLVDVLAVRHRHLDGRGDLPDRALFRVAYEGSTRWQDANRQQVVVGFAHEGVAYRVLFWSDPLSMRVRLQRMRGERWVALPTPRHTATRYEVPRSGFVRQGVELPVGRFDGPLRDLHVSLRYLSTDPDDRGGRVLAEDSVAGPGTLLATR